MQIPQYARFVPRAALLVVCLLLASFTLPAYSQTTSTNGTVFKAYLQAEREGGKALANVQISADGGAGAQVSGSDGLFVLKFTGKKPGEKISLQISKPGWRVLHPIMVERLLPATQETPDKILLCQEAQCDALVLEYFNSKAVLGIKLEYEMRIAKLEGEAKGKTQGQLKAKDEQIAQLQKERDELLLKAKDSAAQLAKLPQGAVSNAYLRATELFLAGHIQQAPEQLKEEEMNVREAAHKQEREEMINSRLLKGKLQVLSGQFDAAQLQFEKAIDIDTQSFDAWFTYARFLQQQRQITKAISAYESCLSLARVTKGKYEVAGILNNLAVLYFDDNRLAAALAANEEALIIKRELVELNRTGFLSYMAGTLNNLGLLHEKENRMSAALVAYEEALKSYRELAAQNRSEYLQGVATTLNNLGLLYDKENCSQAALAAYEEALKSYRELAVKNRAEHLQYIATTLNNLGFLYYKENRFSAALAAYEESLKIRRELAEKNRAAYLPDVALTLNSLGNLHNEENRPAAALRAYEEALQIQRKLALQNRAAYLPDVATTLHNLGRFYIGVDNSSAALLALELAQEQRRELVASNANAFAPNLADTLLVLGNLNVKLGRPAQARKAYEQALTIYRQFLSRNPAVFAGKIIDLEKSLSHLPP